MAEAFVPMPVSDGEGCHENDCISCRAKATFEPDAEKLSRNRPCAFVAN